MEIQKSIRFQDGASDVLRNMTGYMDLTIRAFEKMQSVASVEIKTAHLNAIRQNAVEAGASVVQLRQELQRTQNVQPGYSAPRGERSAVPSSEEQWVSQPAQTIMGSGTERFEQEFRAADHVAQQLYQSQIKISEQARRLRVTPVGMMNDVAATGYRVESLAGRIQNLQNIPINLRTDKTNNELESLRGKLNQAVSVQNNLNSAMAKMDMRAANTAYQELNGIIDSAERGIRDNITAQDQFSASVNSGKMVSMGLVGNVAKYAASLVSVENISKALSLADQVAQTNAGLDLMNQKYGETENIQQMIFESSQRARTSYTETASAITEMGGHAGSSFQNTNELVSFVEQANKQFAIGGASAQEQSNAMVQLTQAMESGTVKGEELNAILNAAPGIAQGIEQSMGWAGGSVRQYAQNGAVSAAVVKNALFDMAEETDRRFNAMPKTFSQIFTGMKNSALMALQPILKRMNEAANSAEFESMINGAIGAFSLLAGAAAIAFDLLVKGAGFIVDNWSIIAPILWGVTTAIGLYTAALVFHNIVQGISAVLKGIGIVAAAVHGTQITAEAAATAGMTSAQIAFNAALLACPLTVIIGAVILFIATLYTAVAVINHMKDTSISATGVIFSAIAVWGASIINNFIVPVWNMFAAFANFIGNLFQDPITAVKVLFFDMANVAMGYMSNIAHGIEDLINHIPGVEVDITSGIDKIQAFYKTEGEKIKSESEWKEYVKTIDFVDYGDAARTGYALGEAVDNKIGGLLDTVKDAFNGLQNVQEETAEENVNTAENTARMADAMDVLDEDMKYMRLIAEQEIINRYTTAEVKVEQSNYNTISSTLDIDGFMNHLTASINEAANIVVEGAH